MWGMSRHTFPVRNLVSYIREGATTYLLNHQSYPYSIHFYLVVLDDVCYSIIFDRKWRKPCHIITAAGVIA